MKRPLEHRASASSRWGGATLAFGALAYAIAVVLFVAVYGQPEGTGPSGEPTLADRAAHYQAQQTFAHALWFVELAAAVLYAVAGFVLQRRAFSLRSPFPAPVAWVTVGVGGVLLSVMYGIMLGGYPAAAADEGLVVLDALNGIAEFLFNIGNIVLGLGLAGAFFAETYPGGVVPRWLALAGVALFLVGTAAAVGLLAGIGALMALAPLGLAGYLLAAYLGFSIWKRGEPIETDVRPREDVA